MIRRLVFVYAFLFTISACSGGGGSDDQACASLDCRTSAYNLLLADVDFGAPNPTATNIRVVASSSYQDMTHPRVSPDQRWVAYTTYNDTNVDGCASLDTGYVNTEVKATRLDGSQTKTIIAKDRGKLSSNNYWYGNSFGFTYLSEPPGETKLYRAQTDTDMNLITGPTEITVPGAILPYDPAALSDAQIVYGGVHDNGGLVASIFLQTLNPAGAPTGLTLGRDSAGTVLYVTNTNANGVSDINENDPKLSPDGTRVAFMRRAANAGANGFGWRVFTVPVASPLTEVNISSSLGTSLLNNDVLPEWVDNNTLVFANIDSTVSLNTRTIWTMQSDGSGRKQVSLPSGYRYSDVFPFLDNNGKQKIIVSAEKIGAECSGTKRVGISIAGSNGIFDPAPTSDGGSRAWMSYSEVTVSPLTPAPPSTVELDQTSTRLAYSDDAGLTWTDAGVINPAIPLTLADPVAISVWQQEVSRLVFDDHDATGTPWKMLWHRHIGSYHSVLDDIVRLFEHGWISLKMADAPGNLAGATERKLFVGSAYDTSNDVTIGPPEYNLSALFPGADALGDCAVFTEPGVLPRPGGIYVGMKCAKVADPSKLVLLKCNGDFSSCDYIGDMLNDTEAALFNASYTGFSAPELVHVNGKSYLIATPTEGAAELYRGCLVFGLTDLDVDTATLKATSLVDRDVGGNPVLFDSLFGSSGSFNGACGYAPEITTGGILYSEFFENSRPEFRMFVSGQNL